MSLRVALSRSRTEVLSALKSLANRPVSRHDRAREAANLIREAGTYRWVGLYDVTPTEIVAIAWTGSDAPAYPRFPVSQGLSGAAVATGQPVVVQDVLRDPRYLTAFGSTRAVAIFPGAAPHDGRIVGTIDVESARVGAFQAEDETFLRDCTLMLRPLWGLTGI
jgi:L-methionine (R)-S-oxide reductase